MSAVLTFAAVCSRGVGDVPNRSKVWALWTGAILDFWRSRSHYEKALLVLFILTLPFVHPHVRSDGIGYYAYLRSPLIDHNPRFSSDWDDPSTYLPFISMSGHQYGNPVTKTGHLPNFYSVGPTSGPRIFFHSEAQFPGKTFFTINADEFLRT